MSQGKAGVLQSMSSLILRVRCWLVIIMNQKEGSHLLTRPILMMFNIILVIVPESYLQALQSTSSNNPRKCPMSSSEASFIKELIRAHGTNYLVGFYVCYVYLQWK